MKANPFICAAMIAVLMPTVVLADNPRDPSMRSAAARARDSEMTRQLNLEEIAKVRRRDANAQGWRAARAGGSDEYAARSRDHKRAMDDYARSRAQHERAMADWRRAVAACRAGDHSACDN